eukprot:m.30702 g.30702  ORF g.30702 m.30702 type:complete len:66 (-) comp6246_c0_seq1:385-582(-)
MRGTRTKCAYICICSDMGTIRDAPNACTLQVTCAYICTGAHTGMIRVESNECTRLPSCPWLSSLI